MRLRPPLMKSAASCDPRAASSRRKRWCGQAVGTDSRKSARAAKRAVENRVPARFSSSEPSRRNASFARWYADNLRRGKEAASVVAEAAVGRERRVSRKPAGDRRGCDGMSVSRRYLRGGLFERVAAIIEGHGFEDFIDRVGRVADGGRPRCERAAAAAAAQERDVLKFFPARALLDEARAVAVGAAVGRLDRGSRTRRGTAWRYDPMWKHRPR
jgi:hypothetical protein